jgi:hypothetical protein
MTNANLRSLGLTVTLGALLFAGGAFTGAATAEPRTVKLDGSCSRGDLLVFDGSDRARCVELQELAFPRCEAGSFLTTPGGKLACVGPSTTPWGAKGLLPVCGNGDLIESEGFGAWRCLEAKR